MYLRLELHNEPLPMSAPFRIAGHVFEAMPHGGFFGSPESAEMEAEVRRFVHERWAV